MKNVLLIGLGRFGRHMAQTLSDLHHQVLAIDKDEHKVQEAMIRPNAPADPAGSAGFLLCRSS